MWRLLKAGGYAGMLVVGWAWHALDVLGRAEAAMNLGGLLGSVQTFAANHQEIGYQLAPWVLMALGLIGLVLMQWPQLLPVARSADTAPVLPPVEAYVPLGEAARLAYEEVERQLRGRLARGSRRGPLAFMAEKVFYEVPVVFGRQPPSTQLLPVNETAGKAFRFSEDGGSLLDGERVVFTDLRVNRADFDTALESIKQSADGESVASWDADEMVPLRVAVGEALTATRQSATAGFTMGYGSDEEQTVFSYFSAMLEHKTPIYGKTPPATDWVRLGRVDLSAETLHEMKSIKPHHRPIRITDLSVKRGDLKSFIKAVNAEA